MLVGLCAALWVGQAAHIGSYTGTHPDLGAVWLLCIIMRASCHA